MARSGSDIFYIINDEMLCPPGKLGGRRASELDTRYLSGLSDFYCEDQMEFTLLDYARGFHRSSTKKTC